MEAIRFPMSGLVEYDSESEEDVTTGRDTTPKLGGVKRPRALDTPGVWPGIVYFDISSNQQIAAVAKAYSECIGVAWKTEVSPFPVPRRLSFHLSLCQSFDLREAEMIPFIDSLRAALAGLASFSISLEGCQLFENDTKERIFPALVIGAGFTQVAEATKRVDGVMRHYGAAESIKVGETCRIQQHI